MSYNEGYSHKSYFIFYFCNSLLQYWKHHLRERALSGVNVVIFRMVFMSLSIFSTSHSSSLSDSFRTWSAIVEIRESYDCPPFRSLESFIRVSWLIVIVSLSLAREWNTPQMIWAFAWGIIDSWREDDEITQSKKADQVTGVVTGVVTGEVKRYFRSEKRR